MNENDVQTFVTAVKNYFAVITGTEAAVGAPYLSQAVNVAPSDFIGSIAISGQRQGAVYFSAPTALLRHLLAIHGETQVNSAMMLDCLGEIANTIAGNARRDLGQDFIISTPAVASASESQPAADSCLNIPIHWKNLPCLLTIDLQRQRAA